MWPQEGAENRARQQELEVGRETTGAMPAVTAVEELGSARAQEWHDVLQVGGGGRGSPQRRAIQRTAHAGEEGKTSEAAADLEAARADVLVRQAVARKVDDGPQQKSGEPGPARGPCCGTRRHVERNDHGLRS